jgi:hypothetical protein
MRAIKYKYAIALNLSITNNRDGHIYDAIEQAKNISDEFEMQVCLTNPFNGKFAIFYSNTDTEELFWKLR